MNSELIQGLRDEELEMMQSDIYTLLKDTEPTVKTRSQMIKNIKGKLEKIKKRNDIIDDDEVSLYEKRLKDERDERIEKEKIQQRKEAINANLDLLNEINDAINNKYKGISKDTVLKWDIALSKLTDTEPSTTQVKKNIKAKMEIIVKILQL